jgi:DNA-binding NtrC family response regulator
MEPTILIVSSPPQPMNELREALTASCGAECVEVAAAGGLSQRLEREPVPDVVVLGWPDEDGEARELVRALRGREPELPVVAVAAHGDVHLAAEAVAAGATDFLVLGDRLEERVTTLLSKLQPMITLRAQYRALREQNERLRQLERERGRLVGESPQIREVLERVARVAAIPRPVLIAGERGTGKELVARAIHAASGRRERPFVAVNCAAFPETLLESELFGHEKGAFTGADRQAAGKFEQASGGTLFLDEISHMPRAFQQKILRVVEYGTFTRVGGSREFRTTARVLAASNADLELGIREGWFLPDLYDRLAFEVVSVPPLRERQGDIAVLARHFLREFLREVPALGSKGFDAPALAALERYRFPGNVRELKTIVERAAYRDTTQEINVEDLALPGGPAGVAPGGGSFHERVAVFQRGLLRQALDTCGGNQAEAARRLGLAYHRFRYFARKLLGN